MAHVVYAGADLPRAAGGRPAARLPLNRGAALQEAHLGLTLSLSLYIYIYIISNIYIYIYIYIYISII